MLDKSKRTLESKSDRFYVGDIIENKITNKTLEVADVILTSNKNVLWYGLCDINVSGNYFFPKDFNRYIPQEAFNNWKLIN